jgi:GDPmannose 4,6-dehydratase
MFGYSGASLGKELNEEDKFEPMSPYAAAKLYGYWLSRIYRKGYGIFAVNGILFNHESPIRGLEFVTRKITNQVAKIAHGLSKEINMGNIEARRDWGYAPEYVDAMWKMIQKDEPDDYVIATGESHSVKEFLQEAFNAVGLDWEDHVKIDKRFMRPLDVPNLMGDFSKSQKELEWKPLVRFPDLVKIMIKEEMERWDRWLNGEKFPWDVPSYPNENGILKRYMRM